MYTTKMLRGPLAPMIREDADEKRALKRVHSLLDLHGLKDYEYDTDTKTLLVDASSYYEGAK